MFWTAMPEAPVHEYGDTLFPKYKVGTSKNGLMSTPAIKSVRSKERS
jgi:hypothetical protein